MMAAKPNAIGEIGLDFHWAKTEVEKQRQHAAFGYQRTLAKKAGLPVVIHCRDAMAEVLDELENNGFSDFMMHCFAGNADDAKRAVGLGGIISVPPMHSKERKKAIKAIGLENVVAETDAPYLGDTKTLSDINISIQIIADALGISFEKAAGATVENDRRFYRI